MHLPPIDQAIFPFVAMSNGGTPVTGISPWAHVSPQPTSDFTTLQRVVKQALRSSKVSLQQAESVPSSRHRLFLLRLADGTRLLLKSRPPPTTRLLRHEHRSLESQAHVLQLITARSTVPVPQVLRFDGTSSGPLMTPYLLTTFQSGTRLSAVSARLPGPIRARVDASLGRHVRALSDSCTGSAFGPPASVLSGEGAPSWRTAFACMLEGALRDAEDMLVTIQYDVIRAHFLAHAALLHEVKTPRLVLLDVGDERNILIDEQTGAIVGLTGFGNAVWGDPLLASVFANPSAAFCEGYGATPGRERGERVRLLL